jgi:hypothetical protein
MDHGIIQGLLGVLIDEVFYPFIQKSDLEILVHRLLMWSSKERYSSIKTPSSFKFLVGPSLYILSLSYTVSGSSGWPIDKMAVSRVYNFSASSKDNEFSFCRVDRHLVRTEPVCNFVQFLIHISCKFVKIFNLSETCCIIIKQSWKKTRGQPEVVNIT